jgi:hypothetical protein
VFEPAAELRAPSVVPSGNLNGRLGRRAKPEAAILQIKIKLIG